MNWLLFKKTLSNPLALTGFIIILLIFVLAMLAPVIAPYDPNEINVKAILLGPSMQHWMGTDGLGRDVLSRMLHGGRISLLVGLVAVGISTLIGILLGAIAGFYRGWVDIFIMRLVDVMLSIPSFFPDTGRDCFFNAIHRQHHDRNRPHLMDGRYTSGACRISEPVRT